MSSSVSCGIVGLPNVGKSTLFNALTSNSALVANYPFATIEPNTGVVAVPDSRLKQLAELYHTDKIIPASVTFVDIAGLVAGASTGEGLGNQFLSHIRGTQAIVHVVRAFKDPNVLRVDQDTTPQKDIEIITTELVLADLQTVQKRLSRFEKEVRANPKLQPFFETLNQAKNILDSGQPLHQKQDSFEEAHWLWLQQEFQFITLKPVIYVFNIDEAGLADDTLQSELTQLVAPASALFICAKLEQELLSLDESDRQELLESYGQSEPGLVQLIHAAYDTLGLQSYLTAGEKEVRAWTIPKGASAPQAAGVIHTDFERGFIAAEVVHFDDLIAAGSLSNARAAGKVQTVGKDYIMSSDDVVEFRFNVSKK